MPGDIPKGWHIAAEEAPCVHPFPHSSPPQTLLDMVENYPTALRSLVLAENSISPELQQQICDLLSEGEEEEEVKGGAGDAQERERRRTLVIEFRFELGSVCNVRVSLRLGLGFTILWG